MEGARWVNIRGVRTSPLGLYMPFLQVWGSASPLDHVQGQDLGQALLLGAEEMPKDCLGWLGKWPAQG